MTGAFSWQNSVRLCPASFCAQGKLSGYSRYLLTSYLCITVPNDEASLKVQLVKNLPAMQVTRFDS